MKITIISIGKFENSPHSSVFEHYKKRLKWQLELKELDLKNSNNLNSLQVKESEGKLILKALKPSSKLITLHEKGKEFSSLNFAKLISDYGLQGSSDLSFIIGGAYGLSDEVLNLANLKLSLGAMTFPHLMVRSILCEQLYRAYLINNGHPYHKE